MLRCSTNPTYLLIVSLKRVVNVSCYVVDSYYILPPLERSARSYVNVRKSYKRERWRARFFYSNVKSLQNLGCSGQLDLFLHSPDKYKTWWNKRYDAYLHKNFFQLDFNNCSYYFFEYSIHLGPRNGWQAFLFRPPPKNWVMFFFFIFFC